MAVSYQRFVAFASPSKGPCVNYTLVGVTLLLFVARAVGVEPNKKPGISQREGYLADMVFWNGNIYPLQRPGMQTKVEALAIKGERIAFVGTEEDARKYISDATKVVDLDGKTLLPGFTDAHVHPVQGGLIALDCDLRGIEGLEAILDALAKYAAEHPDKKWIRGGNLHLASIVNHPSPRTALDKVISDRPVYLVSDGAHSAFVNSKALELAGVNSESADPPQGIIGRVARHERAVGGSV